jgi:ABC-2 type transport system ATP-binding protein
MALDKAIKLHFSLPVPRERLASFGQIERAEGLEAELRIPRGDIASAAQRILQELSVADIAIEDTPIEAVIGRFMTGDGA